MAAPILKYNSTTFPGTPVAGIKFTDPYVSRERDIDYSNEWQTDTDRYIINGTIYMEDDPVHGYAYQDGTNSSTRLTNGRNQIIQFFSQNYKKLETEMGDLDTARVRTISFEDNNYSSMLGYTVILDGPAPVKINSSTYTTQTVKNIIDEFTFTESETGFGTLVHRLSAQGIDDRIKNGISTVKSNALKNAKDWVTARKGVTNMPIWEFISSTINTSADFFKSKETENINRMSATYEVTEEYSFDKELLGTTPAALLKYTTDVSRAKDADASVVRVQIDASWGKDASATIITDIRNQIQGGASTLEEAVYQMALTNSASLNLRVGTGDGVTTTSGEQSFVTPTLNNYSKPLKSASIDMESRTLTYSFEWDDDQRYVAIAGTNDCTLDYTVDISLDHLTGITSASLQGTLLADKSLDISDKVTNLQNWINTTYPGTALHTYLKSLVQTEYSAVGVGGTINPSPENLTVNLNKTQGEATVSATFTDKDYLTGVSASVYQITVNPSIIPYEPKPSIMKDAHYIIFTPGGYRRTEWRANISMEGTKDVPVSTSSLTTLEQRIISVMNSGGSEIVKVDDTATKVYNVANSRQSNIGFNYMPAALNASAGAAASVSSGGRIFLPPHAWLISQQLYPTVTPAGTSWRGYW